MPFVYPIANIRSNAFSVFADLARAESYMIAVITAAGAAWDAAAATDEIKSKGLVSATRWLDQASWLGAKTDEANEHAFPRTGIDGVDPATIPDAIAAASIELAALMVADNNLRANLSSPAAREQHAGSVGQSFFRPRDVQTLTFFPKSIQIMVAPFLAGSSRAGVIPNDVCEKSNLDRPYDYLHGV